MTKVRSYNSNLDSDALWSPEPEGFCLECEIEAVKNGLDEYNCDCEITSNMPPTLQEQSFVGFDSPKPPKVGKWYR